MGTKYISPDDLLEWSKATRDVRKIDRSELLPYESPDPRSLKVEHKAKASKILKSFKGNKKDLIIADRADIDRNTRQRMDQGKIEASEVIDLHGFKVDEAYNILKAAVVRAWENGSRMILVITGKGKKGEGTLKASLPKWLNSSEIKPMILRFNFAKQSDGGEGAYYILLRRNR